jgi:hypothetical protein
MMAARGFCFCFVMILDRVGDVVETILFDSFVLNSVRNGPNTEAPKRRGWSLWAPG